MANPKRTRYRVEVLELWRCLVEVEACSEAEALQLATGPQGDEGTLFGEMEWSTALAAAPAARAATFEELDGGRAWVLPRVAIEEDKAA